MVEGGHAGSLAVLADEAKGLDAEVVAAPGRWNGTSVSSSSCSTSCFDDGAAPLVRQISWSG